MEIVWEGAEANQITKVLGLFVLGHEVARFFLWLLPGELAWRLCAVKSCSMLPTSMLLVPLWGCISFALGLVGASFSSAVRDDVSNGVGAVFGGC